MINIKTILYFIGKEKKSDGNSSLAVLHSKLFPLPFFDVPSTYE